jgi:hypothetical protein
MPPLNVLIGTVDLLHEGVELLLLLVEGNFTSEDACLVLALVLLLLVRGLLVPSIIVASWQCYHDASPFWRLVGVGVNLG